MQDKTEISRPTPPLHLAEDLPYHVELWHVENRERVERVLGRAVNAQLARAIYKAAIGEHPDRRITLRKGNRVVAASG